jgi:glutaredoxin
LRRVTVYYARDCHLCERAIETVRALRDELGFDLAEVDVSGDADLEARYREWLPVVEIDGQRAFVYHVDPEGFRRKLSRGAAQGGRGPDD